MPVINTALRKFIANDQKSHPFLIDFTELRANGKNIALVLNFHLIATFFF